VLQLFLPLQLQSQIDICKKYVGQVETSYNRSPLIDKWNLQAGARLGSSWCMSAVYGIHLEVYTRPLLYRTASCAKQLQVQNKLGTHYRVIKTTMLGNYKLKANSIFIMKHGIFSEKDIGTIFNGHTGYIENDNNGIVTTYEGNTNKRLTRESKGRDGFWKLQRKKRTFLAVLEKWK